MAGEIEFSDKITVKLVRAMASDDMVVQAAQVSSKGENSPDTVPERLIRALMAGKHGSPFEHNAFTFFVEAPIFVFREWQRHRMCLTGDTIITLTSPNDPTNIRYRDMASLWENWHLGVADSAPRKRQPTVKVRRKGFMVQTPRESPQPGETKSTQTGPFATRAEADLFISGMPETWRRRKIPSARRQFAVSIREDDGTTLTQRIADIKKSGVQEVFLIKTTRGDSIKATANHPFLTPTGYQKVDELRVGGEVIVSGTRGVSKPDPMVSKELRMGVGHWTSRMRKSLLPAGGMSACAECAENVANEALELDHVVPVVLDISLALTESNLQALCKPCHRTKTTFEQRYRRGGKFVERGGVAAVIESIESCGMEETYDIEMEGEFPNFIANNFVVHNSSFNEMSGRYTQLLPKFYAPSEDRPMVNLGTKMKPDFTRATPDVWLGVRSQLGSVALESWVFYQRMLSNGVAHEVARMVLPVNIYSQMYWTVNARSLMNFLSLRVESDDSQVRSYPQLEIEMGATQIEEIFAERMPATHAAFVANGRVAP